MHFAPDKQYTCEKDIEWRFSRGISLTIPPLSAAPFQRTPPEGVEFFGREQPFRPYHCPAISNASALFSADFKSGQFTRERLA